MGEIVETQHLKLINTEKPPEKVCKYEFVLQDFPSRTKMFELLEKPPYEVVCPEHFKFSHGILGRRSHSVQLKFSRKSQDISFVCTTNTAYYGYERINDDVNVTVKVNQVELKFHRNEEPNVLLKAQLITHPTDTFGSQQTWHVVLQIPAEISIFSVLISVSEFTRTTIVCDDVEETVPQLHPGFIRTKQLFLSDHLSDVKVTGADGAVFSAHKLILSERSTYFQKMFQSQMKESIDGIIQLDDMNGPELRILLEFLYRGNINDSELDLHVTKLIKVADKYVMTDLYQVCEKYLLNTLSMENVLETYDLAQLVSDKGRLEKKCKEFICLNRKELAEFEEFQEFVLKYPDLIMEMVKL